MSEVFCHLHHDFNTTNKHSIALTKPPNPSAIMPRQRGGAAPVRPRPTVPAAKPATTAPAPARQHSTAAAPPPAAPAAPPAAATPQGPGLFGQMASTAAYVSQACPQKTAILATSFTPHTNTPQRCRSWILNRPRRRRLVQRRQQRAR